MQEMKIMMGIQEEELNTFFVEDHPKLFFSPFPVKGKQLSRLFPPFSFRSLPNPIILQSKPIKLLSPSMYPQPSTAIIPQSQEIASQGCCFSNYLKQSHDISHSPSRVRVYSQRKGSKEKKIDLTIAKRGHSNPKDSILKESILRVKSNGKDTNVPTSDVKYSLCTTTKITASRNSLRTSQVNPRCLRIERSSEEFKCQPLSTNSTMRQLHENKQIEPVLQRKGSIFNGISEIEIVAEDFVSQGSSTIKLVSALCQGQGRQMQERDPFANLDNRQTCNMNALCTKQPIKQPNSFSLADRKRYQKPDNPKKRLVL